MTKRILITGAVSPKLCNKALAWLLESVAETRPDEIVCTEASPGLLDRLREAYDGPVGVHSGTFEPHHNVTELPALYDIAPGWVSLDKSDSADESPIAGNTALRAVRRLGKSVVVGSTGRLGMVTESKGYRGEITSQSTGLEVGNLADLRGTTHTGTQRGFGLLTVDGDHVQSECRRAV
ncbi:hypothetical protein ACXPWS_09130 [Mycobacterium sp. BMJ-28]